MMDEEDIDVVADNALLAIKHAEIYAHPDAFRKLHERLLSAGQSNDRVLMKKSLSCKVSASTSAISASTSTLGSIAKDLSSQKLQGTNPIIIAASKSGSHNEVISNEISKNSKAKSSAGLGKGWFNFQPLEMDEKLKRDLSIIRMRNYLDPKRFYKNPDKQRPIVHIGTVIEGPAEYKSSRLTNRERKQSLVDEILADSKIRDYTKRKYMDIQQENAKVVRRGRKPLRKKAFSSNHKKINKLF